MPAAIAPMTASLLERARTTLTTLLKIMVLVYTDCPAGSATRASPI
jgi:hypothetical protein